MNSPLEYRNMPAEFCRKTGTVRNGLQHVPAGELVTVCAWHEGQAELTAQLISAGYQLSHGICSTCRETFRRTNPETDASLSSSSQTVAGTRRS